MSFRARHRSKNRHERCSQTGGALCVLAVLRRAIYVTRDIEYGFARMFEMLRENAGEKGIRVFRNLDDALTWIFAGRDTK